MNQFVSIHFVCLGILLISIWLFCLEEVALLVSGDVDTVPHRTRNFLTPSTSHAVSHFRWNTLMLHLSTWKQMRSTCSVSFVVRCLFRAVQLFGSKTCWAEVFVCHACLCAFFRKRVIRLMSLFGENRSTTFCSSPPPPSPSPPSCPTTRRERNPPHKAPFRTRMCCVALWQKPSTTQVTSPKSCVDAGTVHNDPFSTR